MDAKRLLSIQSERGAKAIGTESMQKTIDFVITECRRFIRERSESYRDLDPERKTNTIKELIVSYVMTHPHLVEGYVDEENRPDTNKLVDRLVEDITDYGILTAPMTNPDIYEIRCNGKEIKIEIKGRVQDLRDKDNNIVSFESVEQQEVILKKLLGDKRLSPKDAIVNARTVEGYRIAAVHSSAVGADPLDPTAPKYHVFVLRKFRDSKMRLGDIVKNGTMSDGMARLLALLPAGKQAWITGGPTASGKTTTNNAILQAVPKTTRTVLIQNPSEIDMRFRDLSGRVFNDVVHLEAVEKENPTQADPTYENLMDHLLRLSPTFVCLGEIRKNIEFKLAMKILQAGHPMNTTCHFEDAEGGITRFLTAYLAESGNEPSHLALATLTAHLKFIIVQKIMMDGTRKVIQITEVLGVDSANPNRALLNDIYRYEIIGDPEYNESGDIIKINGRHKRVGKLSQSTVDALKLEGVATAQYEFLIKDVDDNEIETYTGEDIENYGKQLGVK